MSFDVAWSFAARKDLQRLHWRTAGDVDGAVQRLASSGAGHVERIPGEAMKAWLHVGRHRVLLQIDAPAKTVFVLRVY